MAQNVFILAFFLLASLQAASPAFAVEDFFRTLETWDTLDSKGTAEIALTRDTTTPPSYGPEVLAVKGDAVVGLLKGIHLVKGEILVLYREMKPQEMDADGLLLFHGQFGSSVAEEHNAKTQRAHCWMENDNDSGLHFTRLDSNGRETILLQTPGLGLVNGDWNRTGWIWQKVRVNGAKIQGKYWPANSAEPDDWQLEVEDAGLSEGRVGFRIGSGDVHIAYFSVGENLPPIAAPVTYLFPDTERVTRADEIGFSLFTHSLHAEKRIYQFQLEKDGMEVVQKQIAVSCEAGEQVTELRLTSLASGESAAMSVGLPEALSSGSYRVRLLREGHVVSETAFEVLDLAGLRGRFEAVKRSATQLRATLASIVPAGKHVRRLRVVADATLAHHDLGLAQLDGGDIDAAKTSLYFALEALDELRGYKGQWLQEVAPDLSLELPPLTQPTPYAASKEPANVVYSPKYLVRFGSPRCNTQSWVMGRDYAVTIPWSVEGASPDRDFTYAIEVSDPLDRYVVARTSGTFEVPTSQWISGETYVQTAHLSVLAEDASERPAAPNITDGWHVLCISVRDATTRAPLLLDNQPHSGHGRPEVAYEACRVYISSTPIEIELPTAKGSTAGQPRSEIVSLHNLGMTTQEGNLVLSVFAETERLLERVVKDVSIGPSDREDVVIDWSPQFCGDLTLEVAFIQDGVTKTVAEEVVFVTSPHPGQSVDVVRLNSQTDRNGAVQTSLHLKADKPATEAMTVRIYADKTLLAERTTRRNELTMPVTPHFGYYDVEIQVGEVTSAHRIVGTSVRAHEGQLLVNGEPFIVKGINVHGMDPKSPARTRLQMELLKKLGFNSWRGDFPSRWQTDMAYDVNTAYSALAPFSCIDTDELFSRIDGPKLTTCRELSRMFLERYADSAGVVLWNSCNEIGGETTNFVVSLYPVYKHLDPAQRPVHYANLYGQDRWQGQDVMAVNYYFGRGERATDRHPIIEKSIDLGMSRGIPVIFTEYNSFYGSIHTTGAEAVRDLFGWGVKQGMSGGYFYMRFTDASHPSVFDSGLNTHKVLDEALTDTFSDVAFRLVDDASGGRALQTSNKRNFTLRKLRLDLEINGTSQPEQFLPNLKPHTTAESPIKQDDKIRSTEVHGTLSYESHHGIRSKVRFRCFK